MRRLSLCLLIAFASATAYARDACHASPGSGGGAPANEAPARPAKQKVPPPTREAPVRETRSRTAIPGDNDPVPAKLRWHSFLPGMFR